MESPNLGCIRSHLRAGLSLKAGPGSGSRPGQTPPSPRLPTHLPPRPLPYSHPCPPPNHRSPPSSTHPALPLTPQLRLNSAAMTTRGTTARSFPPRVEPKLNQALGAPETGTRMPRPPRWAEAGPGGAGGAEEGRAEGRDGEGWRWGRRGGSLAGGPRAPSSRPWEGSDAPLGTDVVPGVVPEKASLPKGGPLRSDDVPSSEKPRLRAAAWRGGLGGGLAVGRRLGGGRAGDGEHATWKGGGRGSGGWARGRPGMWVKVHGHRRWRPRAKITLGFTLDFSGEGCQTQLVSA